MKSFQVLLLAVVVACAAAFAPASVARPAFKATMAMSKMSEEPAKIMNPNAAALVAFATAMAPLAAQGCVPLAIHPAMTFTGADEDVARLSETCFGITAADEIGYAIAQSLVLEIGGEPFAVREEARTLYHAALAHGSNHVVTLIADSVTALRAALSGPHLLGQQPADDAPGGLAERIVGPLARAALENTLRRGQAALTGPVARGDAAAVAAHLAALADVDSELAQAYCADSLRTAQRAHAAEEVIDVLTEWSHPAGPSR
jgi:predicted short-subunit dehydrogenase-like oxidoreductase (DUF2520 family)